MSATSCGTTSDCHTSANGSSRVRHVRGGFTVDGNAPLCHFRAARSLIPAAAAAAASVFPAIRFSRNRRTCASVTNPSSTRKTGSVTHLAAAPATGRSPRRRPAKIIVVDHLLYAEAPYRTPALHYWARETRNAAAELDYVIAVGSRIVPVEVKAGATGSLRSLHQFIREKSSPFALRFNGDPPSLLRDSRKLPDGTTVRYDLLSLPLYLVGQARRLIGEATAESSS